MAQKHHRKDTVVKIPSICRMPEERVDSIGNQSMLFILSETNQMCKITFASKKCSNSQPLPQHRHNQPHPHQRMIHFVLKSKQISCHNMLSQKETVGHCVLFGMINQKTYVYVYVLFHSSLL